jgi:hypothetical protein
MTAPNNDTTPARETIETAEAMIAACRARIDPDPHVPPEIKALAHLELNAALLKFMTALAREAGILQ